jgi:DNA mismatch repair protein MutL
VTIKLLSNVTINRIAAGEVVERPASALKELLENAIDAQATSISVTLHAGGRNLIAVSDNGIGMGREDLSLATHRHATSKLNEEDLSSIKYLGFRGEALPSIASISRTRITSRAMDSNDSWSINVEGGIEDNIRPTSTINGTLVEVHDLFFATPARLKFLRSERTELEHCSDMVNRLAMANPNIAFTVKTEEKTLLSLKISDQKDRVMAVLGSDFRDNSTFFESNREGIAVHGYISIPTFNRKTSNMQYLYVNGRPVRDKVILGAIRAAYGDLISRDRYPILTLFLDVAPEDVDVNVHPAKTEVRFRDDSTIRGLIISAISEALRQVANTSNTTLAYKAVSYISTETHKTELPSNRLYDNMSKNIFPTMHEEPRHMVTVMKSQDDVKYPAKLLEDDHPLGMAIAQLHGSYIIAQSKDSLVIVDQHAAHERLTYEEMKASYEANAVNRQRLLRPEIINLTNILMDKFVRYKDLVTKMGFTFSLVGDNTLIIYEVPLVLDMCDVKSFFMDLLDELMEKDAMGNLCEAIEGLLSRLSCHKSIRANHHLDVTQMNALLRRMEKSTHSGQCNHGRPSYIKLKLVDIEKLFERT